MSTSPASEAAEVLVALDHNFYEYRGNVYTQLAFGYDYWADYLDQFDSVVVLARMQLRTSLPPDSIVASGRGVSFIGVPHFRGPSQLFKRLPRILRAVTSAAQANRNYILRNGTVSTLLHIALLARGLPYNREVQGNQRESISSIQASHPRRLGYNLISRISHTLTGWQIRNAEAVSYTSRTLMVAYPPGPHTRSFVFSSVSLTPDACRAPRPPEDFSSNPVELIYVGRLEREKGGDLLIEALAILNGRFPSRYHLNIVGGGTQQTALTKLSERLEISSRVTFHGQLPRGPLVHEIMDNSDLFVLASRTEGLPRALVEAMARGLPAVATNVGGTPDLLPESHLACPENPQDLADRIQEATVSSEFLHEFSMRNFELATTRYSLSRMGQEKSSFYQHVKGSTT